MEHRTRAGGAAGVTEVLVLDFDGVLVVRFHLWKNPPVPRDAAGSVGLTSLVRLSQLESVKRRTQCVAFLRP